MLSQKPSSVNTIARIKLLEKENKLLKERVNELSSENATLREINVKFQIENFNLQKKITQLESQQIDNTVTLDDEDEEQFTVIEEEEEVNAAAQKQNSECYEEVMYDNEENIETEEYLDEESYAEEETADEDEKKPQNENIVNKSKMKRKHSNAFESEESSPQKKSKDDIKYEITIINENSEDIIGEIEQCDEMTNDSSDPKEALHQIYQLASKSAVLHKLKSVGKGKQKDSAFVSRVLDILFDRLTLASSSAQGQKCQSKLHLPAKPALNQDKLDLCKKAFIYRLRTEEEVTQEEKQLRLKNFLKLVNDKIQNCRKCVNRIDSTKILEI